MRFRLKKYLMFIVFSISVWGIYAQANYDIRLKFNVSNSMDNLICYDVQLRSANGQEWGLAGQNYRLFYNSTQVEFSSGSSQLGPAYQSFSLVQHASHINATNIEGDLPFADNLGFLNYAIDLNNIISGGATLSPNDTWLITSQLCFNILTDENNNPANVFQAVWGQDGKTNPYANSFVEISEWVGSNQTQTASGENFYDVFYQEEQTSAIRLALKICLQGAYETASGLMRDNLRTKQLIPLKEPYSDLANFSASTAHFLGKEVIKTTPEVLEKEGNNAIIDWVLVELRSKNNPAEIKWTTASLLQRDGDIVGINGFDPISFPIMADSLYIAIRHRNHLGIMTDRPIGLSQVSINEIDFTNTSTLTYGENARIKMGTYETLWGGDADGNGYVIFVGGGVGLPDSDQIFFNVFSDSTNIHSRYNHITKGYLSGDTNLDGEVRYQGGNNDIDELIFFNIYQHPKNKEGWSNFFIRAQIPD